MEARHVAVGVAGATPTSLAAAGVEPERPPTASAARCWKLEVSLAIQFASFAALSHPCFARLRTAPAQLFGTKAT